MSLIFHSKFRDLSHKGLGFIDHPDGRVFFSRYVWSGDEGEFQIAENAQKYDEALLLSNGQTPASREGHSN